MALNNTNLEGYMDLFESVKCKVPSIENIQDIIDYEINLGTNLAKDYCSILGLPSVFSSKGTSDTRSPMEIINSVKRLPPLLDFQEHVKEKSQEIFRKKDGRAMIVMPTGSGKTRTSIEAVFHYVLRNGTWPPTILWIADRDELCEQSFQSFKQIFVHACQDVKDDDRPANINLWRYWGGLDNRHNGNESKNGIYVTSVQQLQSRLRVNDIDAEEILSEANIVIVDEAHRNLDFIEELNIKFRDGIIGAQMIGLTATPLRRDRAESSRLHDLFGGEIICPIEGAEHDIDLMINQLTERNILARKIDVNPYDLIDSSSINSTIGEKQYLEKVVQIITKTHNQNRRSILVFTKKVEHARIISSTLKLANHSISAEYLDASTPVESRKNIIQSFRSGGINVLLNYGILTTGFDAPNTDAVVICRTLDQEDSLYKQMVGRGLRGHEFGGTNDCFIIHFEEEY